MLQVSVYRYNPDKDAAPYMQDFQVDTNGKDVMVLDVLALIKEQDEGFSYRRSCREGAVSYTHLRLTCGTSLSWLVSPCWRHSCSNWRCLLYTSRCV